MDGGHAYRFEVEKEALRETITLEADERAREEKRAALLVQEKKLRAQAALAEQREMRTRKREVCFKTVKGGEKRSSLTRDGLSSAFEQTSLQALTGRFLVS